MFSSLIKIHLSYAIEVHIMYRIHIKPMNYRLLVFPYSFRICLKKIASFEKNTILIDDIVIWFSYNTTYRFSTLMIK